MRSRSALTLGGAGLTAGLALWITGATLDVLPAATGTLRVALCPSWSRLAVLVGLGLAAAFAAGAVFRLRDRPDRLALLEPIFALNLLLLPYLPWLGDQVPAIRALAGPGRWLLWGIVLAQVGWIALDWWRAGREEARPRVAAAGAGPAATGTVRRARGARLPGPLAAFLAGIAVFGIASAWLVGPPLFPGGDEPHYLVIAQSLWRDRDLAIENNHARGDYHEYYAGDLEPHYLARGTDGRIYSVHPIGLPLLLAPVYALGRYRLVVFVLVVIAAAAAAVMWRAAAARAGPASATFAWVGVALAAPYLFNSYTVYPEIAAALAVMLAFTLVAGPADARIPRWAATGVSVAALPWLSTKYAPMAAVLTAIALWRIWRFSAGRSGRGARVVWQTLAVLGPFALSLAAWFSFFYAIWGSPLPTAAYGTYNQTSLARALVGAPGLLFDQEHGLLAFAPLLVLAATGLWAMVRAGGEARRTAAEIGLTFSALLVTVGAFWIWWGGDAMPARPVASALLLLGLPVAWRYHHTAHPVVRASQHLLLLLGLAVSASLAGAAQGMLLATGRDGISEFLRWLSPDWRLWALAPSFIVHAPGVAAAHTLMWLAVASGAALTLRRMHAPTPGRAAFAASAGLTLALLALAVAVPPVLGSALQPDVDVAARSRVPLLDRFDAGRSAAAVVYDPWRAIRPSDVPRLFTLRATPGLRRARQPRSVLLNMRLALPPGEYAVRMQPAAGAALPASGQVGLQVGRLGEPLESWPVTFVPGGSWRGTFTLPVAASFVGFDASEDLQAAIAEIEVTPIRIVDVADRPPSREVLGAAAWPETRIFFHDDRAYPEATGMWIRGGAAAVMTVCASPEEPLALSVHCGPKANTVRVETRGWRQAHSLAPGESARVVLPPSWDGTSLLTISTGPGFVPAEIDPRSRDRRQLGCWVELRN